MSLSQVANAELIKDSKASLEARNFYLNRDFRQDGASQSKHEEWAQGFILCMDSGYTEGTVGFGIDTIGMLVFKLDSGCGTAGSNLLVPDRSGGSQDYFSDLSMTTGGRRGITVTGDKTTDAFQFLNGTYQLSKGLTCAYYYSNLEDLYKRNSFNLVHVLPLGEAQSLKTDLRYARSTDDGRSNVDSKAFGAMATYGMAGTSSVSAKSRRLGANL